MSSMKEEGALEIIWFGLCFVFLFSFAGLGCFDFVFVFNREVNIHGYLYSLEAQH